jgi:2-oxoisovalerate dehydrogenase E1 component alpha subunit
MRAEQTVVLVYFGDGASSQGETHEAMNFAGVHRLPVVFICENNRYAISVPQRMQMGILEVASRAAAYGFPGFTVDGMDFIGCYEATREAVSHARNEGPVLLEMMVERFMSHTTDDDDRRYRPPDEVEQARLRDPVMTLGKLLLEHGILSQDELDETASSALADVDAATDAADYASPPDASTLHSMVYSG